MRKETRFCHFKGNLSDYQQDIVCVHNLRDKMTHTKAFVIPVVEHCYTLTHTNIMYQQLYLLHNKINVRCLLSSLNVLMDCYV